MTSFPHRAGLLTRAALVLLLTALAAPAGAQAWNYPSFQQPLIAEREYNFGIADGGDGGTSVLFQWREGFDAANQFSVDIGFADADEPDDDNAFFVGAQWGNQINRANADLPLDLLFTAGANAAFIGGTNIFSVPIGVSAGHRFPLQGALAITPYVHPRVSIDFCSDCGAEDDTDIGVNFDIGASFEITPQVALRASVLVGGSEYLGDDDAFGISLAWTPPGLRPR